MKDILKEVSAIENNPKLENILRRREKLYERNNNIRSEFERDYTRIVNSQGYRRLKHKTQVFFSPQNDHICTRIEHVTLVESISYTIAKYLGLNTELTKAISTAHDIGHSPFGHQGEKILAEIKQRELGETFWHEKNGLELVDKIELLEDPYEQKTNLNLTYAVRDGIISHCGEIDEKSLRPREEYIDLYEYTRPNQYAPYTWEGCVVKISDKISYLGRDIGDSISLKILNNKDLKELHHILELEQNETINNTVIINYLIGDLCKNSSIEKGLCFSDKAFKMMNELKKFNYKKIYLSDKLEISVKYFKLVLNEIFDILKESYKNKDKMVKICSELVNDFEDWLRDYWDLERSNKCKNNVLFNMEDEKDYIRAIIYYISGMTDNYAIEMYNKIIRF